MTAASCKIFRGTRSGSIAAGRDFFARGFADFEAWRDHALEEEERAAA